MKKHLSVLLILLALVFSVSGQRTKPSKTEKNLRAHVAYLASDELEGRRTGERGATFAAGYIANMFARYKLKGGHEGTDGAKASFLQPFEYVSGIETGADNSMSFFRDGGPEAKLVEATDWMPVAYSPNGSIPRTEIVFAGWGITANETGHDDYAGLDVRNKIVAVLDGAPDGGNPHSPLARFTFHAKAGIAKEKGARALVVISDQNELGEERLARLEYNQTLGETAVPVLVVTRRVGRQMLGVETDEELTRIVKWLADKPESARVVFEGLPRSAAAVTVDLRKKMAEAYNVIGVIEGRDKSLRHEVIIIGAHYDHLGRGGRGSLAPDSTEIHNGADDNASGTSALLELARQFRREKKNRRTLVFVAFGGEEDGLLGSKAYTENPAFPLENTVAMINMDMVGRLTGNKLTVGGIGTAEGWKDLVEGKNDGSVLANSIVKASGTGEANRLFELQLNQDGFGPSDHSSFYARKIPVLFFFTGTHTDYHKPSDDADKINYEGLEKITGFVAGIVKAVDRDARRPVYRVAESSNTMGRRGFNVSLGTIPSYADNTNDGLVLDGVRGGSPADKAGLRSGDKVVELAGREIRNISDYMFMLGEMKAGEEYEVVVLRGAERLTLKIVPDPR